MSIAGSSRLAGVPGGAELTLVFTRDGRLRPKIVDDAVAAAVEPLDVERVEAVADDPAEYPYRARIEELRRQRYGGAPDLGDILATREGRAALLVFVAVGAIQVAAMLTRAGVLSPSVLGSALLAVPFACVCVWHLIAMPFIWLGLALTRWPRLLARWWARPRFDRRLAQRLGVALVVAGAVVSVAPIG
jgi:hypothetical protein